VGRVGPPLELKIIVTRGGLGPRHRSVTLHVANLASGPPKVGTCTGWTPDHIPVAWPLIPTVDNFPMSS
jgi:hypothetical protein